MNNMGPTICTSARLEEKGGGATIYFLRAKILAALVFNHPELYGLKKMTKGGIINANPFILISRAIFPRQNCNVCVAVNCNHQHC